MVHGRSGSAALGCLWRVANRGCHVISAGENELISGWFNTERAIILAIQRQPGANVIDTVNRVKAMLPVLQASIPPAIKVSIIADRTDTIRASVSDVQFTLILTVFLVVMLALGGEDAAISGAARAATPAAAKGRW